MLHSHVTDCSQCISTIFFAIEIVERFLNFTTEYHNIFMVQHDLIRNGWKIERKKILSVLQEWTHFDCGKCIQIQILWKFVPPHFVVQIGKNALSSFADQRNAENYVFRKYDVKKVVKIKISPHRLTETGNA